MRTVSALALLTVIGLPLLPVRAKPPADPTDAVIIIKTDRGAGTGFICQLGDSNYVVTCTHVLSGGQQFEFQTHNGGRLQPVALELADDRDLARVHITDPNPPALVAATNDTKISNPVVVFGNSEGAGVVTRLEGKVQAVGPALLEVDAQFVKGNSGSPILDAHNQALAVASFVSRAGTTNWVNNGTRFTETRRFGVRLQGVRWIPVTPRRLYEESSILSDLDAFLHDATTIVHMLHEKNFNDLVQLAVQQRADNPPRYHDPAYSQKISAVCTSLNDANQAYKRGLDLRSGSVAATMKSAEMAYKSFPTLALQQLHETRWSTQHYRDRAAKLEKIFTDWKLEAR